MNASTNSLVKKYLHQSSTAGVAKIKGCILEQLNRVRKKQSHEVLNMQINRRKKVYNIR